MRKRQPLKNSKNCSETFTKPVCLKREMENAELKEGYILDYATGKQVDIRKPEEAVRQEYEKTLFEDFNYDCEMIDIEVPIQRGEKHSKKNKNERADIVIYKTIISMHSNQKIVYPIIMTW